jgi:hypothetical protein
MRSYIPFVCILVLCIVANLKAQEMLVGGNMEDPSAWSVINYKPELSEYEFNFISDGPAEGQRGCLEVTASGLQETDIIFFQELTLIGGAQYEFKGAFKDFSGTINQFWCEVLYDTVEPPPADSGDFGGIIIVGFNTWDGTAAGIDGTFQDDFAKGDSSVFTAPGESGIPVTVYLVIDVGCWMGGSAYFFDVGIDEVSLVQVGATGVEENNSNIPERFSLHQNYPNPFNPKTTISYSLQQASAVTLKVFDAMGGEVATIIQNETKAAGNHEVTFNAVNLPSGVYFYRLQTENYTEIKKMSLLK